MYIRRLTYTSGAFKPTSFGIPILLSKIFNIWKLQETLKLAIQTVMSCSALLIWKEKWLDKRVESAVWPVTSLLYFRSGFNIARHIHFRDEYFFINCKNKLLLFLNLTFPTCRHQLLTQNYHLNQQKLLTGS